MSERDDLGQLLHRIAATVGDPPEHGLDRVDARRRRRTRHRRGAVAAAVALAVTGVAASPWLTGLSGEDANLAAVDDTGTEEAEAGPQLPDVVQLNCNPSGLEVPVGYIQTQRDGMHVAIHNGFGAPTEVWVKGEAWDSGLVTVAPGDSDLRQPVPPGELTVGCLVDGIEQELLVDLIDVEHHYKPPKLSCPPADQVPLTPAQFRPTPSAVQAGRLSVGAQWRPGEDQIKAVTGYPAVYYRYKTTSPVVRLERDDETVAFIYLADANMTDGKSASDPWTSVLRIDACRELTEGQTTSEMTPTTIAVPPPP